MVVIRMPNYFGEAGLAVSGSSRCPLVLRLDGRVACLGAYPLFGIIEYAAETWRAN